MKRSKRGLSKQGLVEKGLNRDRFNKVWNYKGKTYPTLRDVISENIFDTRAYKMALKKFGVLTKSGESSILTEDKESQEKVEEKSPLTKEE